MLINSLVPLKVKKIKRTDKKNNGSFLKYSLKLENERMFNHLILFPARRHKAVKHINGKSKTVLQSKNSILIGN